MNPSALHARPIAQPALKFKCSWQLTNINHALEAFSSGTSKNIFPFPMGLLYTPTQGSLQWKLNTVTKHTPKHSNNKWVQCWNTSEAPFTSRSMVSPMRHCNEADWKKAQGKEWKTSVPQGLGTQGERNWLHSSRIRCLNRIRHQAATISILQLLVEREKATCPCILQNTFLNKRQWIEHKP